MMLTKVSVRTVLTSEMLEVHWGMSNTRVPIGAITDLEAQGDHEGHPHATMGMKMWGPNGWVLVKWKDESGKDKSAHFPADNPALLVEKIQGVRASRVSAGTGLRVEDEAAEAAAEALAEEAAVVNRAHNIE